MIMIGYNIYGVDSSDIKPGFEGGSRALTVKKVSSTKPLSSSTKQACSTKRPCFSPPCNWLHSSAPHPRSSASSYNRSSAACSCTTAQYGVEPAQPHPSAYTPYRGGYIGIIKGTTIGDTKGDTRSLDLSSYGRFEHEVWLRVTSFPPNVKSTAVKALALLLGCC